MKAVRDAALVEGGGRGRLEALRARLEGAAGRTADSVAERDDRPRDGPLVQRVGAGRQGSVGRPALSRPRGGREGRDRGRGGPLSRGGLRPGARGGRGPVPPDGRSLKTEHSRRPPVVIAS
ncbi:unnamed protein product [Prorocentrum cordatum]|uniref:Uncharacterized protein n=1 Tax=Prorocentrum cordatum TaxID=2364126 RepID=A0ABN9UFQ3_9DINO|nr:unnamed protein product [Polarella glacialis]